MGQHHHEQDWCSFPLLVAYPPICVTSLIHVCTASLGGQVPLQVLYGITPDISIMLLYTFYQPIFYAAHDQHFPSDSKEKAGYWVGFAEHFAEHCGDSLTHMVPDADTLKINYRSALRPRTLKEPNKRLVDAGGEEDHQPHSKDLKHPTSLPDGEKSAQPDNQTVFIKSRHHDGPTSSKPLPEFNQDDLVGRTFLLLPADNWERLMAKITRNMAEDIEKADGESYILGLAMGNWKRSSPTTNLWITWKLQPMRTMRSVKIRALIGHQGPLKSTDPNWKGCKYIVLVD